MSLDALTARALTGRLIARIGVERGAPTEDIGAVVDAYGRTAKLIARSIGETGFEALAARAFAKKAIQHPLLKDITLGRPENLSASGLAEVVELHGEQAVGRAVEAALEALLELLGKLIGMDMVASLVDRSRPLETQVEKA